VTIPEGAILALPGEQKVTLPGVALAIYFQNGEERYLSREDAEAVLNDGMLIRHHIPVTFL
jgi:hypothetical protein